MLSSESTDDGVAWSRAQYMNGAQIWQAFKLPGSPPYAEGIFANQPSPYKGKVASAWRTWLWLNVALVALWLYFSVSSAGHDVVQQKYTFSPGRPADSSFFPFPFQFPLSHSNS